MGPAPKGLTSWMLSSEIGVTAEWPGVSLSSVPYTSVSFWDCVPWVKECRGQFPLRFSFTSLQVVNLPISIGNRQSAFTQLMSLESPIQTQDSRPQECFLSGYLLAQKTHVGRACYLVTCNA